MVGLGTGGLSLMGWDRRVGELVIDGWFRGWWT